MKTKFARNITTIAILLITASFSIISHNSQQELLPTLTTEQVKKIASNLCGDVYLSYNNGFEEKRFQKIIADGLGVDPNSENITAFVSAFLNKYKQELICGPDNFQKDFRKKHLYKQAMLRGISDLFEKILLEDDNYKIDFNAYEMVDGKKETILDYIDKLIGTNEYDKKALAMIQMEIEELGGKRGADL